MIRSADLMEPLKFFSATQHRNSRQFLVALLLPHILLIFVFASLLFGVLSLHYVSTYILPRIIMSYD
jgi:hypothetical protein